MARKISLLNSRVSQLQQEIKPEFVAKTDTGKLRKTKWLSERIAQFFNEEELHSLIYDLGYNPEKIINTHDTRRQQSLEFVLFIERHSKTEKLLKRLMKKRPSIKWR